MTAKYNNMKASNYGIIINHEVNIMQFKRKLYNTTKSYSEK